MKFFRHLWFWMRRRDLERELNEEVRQHLELKVQENITGGMALDQAYRHARSEFGNPALAKEHTRQSWGFPLLESICQDIRFALRQLRKNPGFTTIAILTLALGIGANSAMFSCLNAFLLTSLPVKNPQQIVHLRNLPNGGGFDQKAYEFLRDHNHTLAGMIAYDSGTVVATVDGEPRFVPIDFVSANLYSLLGVPAYRGRVLVPDDDFPGKPAVAVISYGYWQQRFGLDPSVIGKTVQFKGVSCTIVGVAPPWFHGLRIAGPATPVTMPSQWRQHLGLKDHINVDPTARLAQGVDMQQAQADLNLVYHQFLQSVAGKISDPAARKDLLEHRIAVLRTQGPEVYEESFTLQLRLLQAVVGLVLLIACVNLANLLLSRGNARQREMGVRLALGARRSRIVRQLLTENLLLALCGGAVGLLLSTQLAHLLLFIIKGSADTTAFGLRINGTVLSFTAVLSLLTGLLFGFLPALRSSRGVLLASVRGGEVTAEGGPVRTSRILVIPQIAISLVVLILSGLLLRSVQRLHEVDLGFQRDHLLTFWLMPTVSGYDGEKELRLYDDVLSELNQLSGVRAASMSRRSLLRRGRTRGLTVDGVAHPDATLVFSEVAPRFFETLQLPLLSGRDFTAQDHQPSIPVTVINEAMAEKYFPDVNPIGHRIRLEREEYGVERSIVGVIKNMKFSFRSDMPEQGLYIPYAQAPEEDRGQAMIKVNTAGDPAAMIPAIRERVHAVAKDLPPINISTEDDVLNEENIGQELSLSKLLGGFGALALGLALLGIYGTVSYSVSRRIREIAIRMALGAQRGGLLLMIVRESLRFVLVGAAIGAALALAASRLLESFLFGIKSFDPPTYILLILALTVAAAFAAYLPARRVAQVDPIVALRHE